MKLLDGKIEGTEFTYPTVPEPWIQFRLIAASESGESSPVAIAVEPFTNISNEVPPAPVTGVVASYEDGQVTIQWEASPLADYYEVSGERVNDTLYTVAREQGVSPLEESFSIVAVNAFGTSDAVNASIVIPALPENYGNLANLSTRSTSGNGSEVMIGGFVLETVNGMETVDVVIRVVGPSLLDFGVSNADSDPSLQLFDAQATLLKENDDWRTDVNASLLESAGLTPVHDSEAALYASLPTGAYTLFAVAQEPGKEVLFEVFLAGQGILRNLSTRGVHRENAAMIAGFVVSEEGSFAVSATGPSLGNFGIEGYAPDPSLSIFAAGQSDPLVTIDNTADNAVSRNLLETWNLIPENELEAAWGGTLSPGAYTAVVNGTGGLVIIEVNAIP